MALTVPVGLGFRIFLGKKHLMDGFHGHLLGQIVAEDILIRTYLNSLSLRGLERPLMLPGAVFLPELIHIFEKLRLVDTDFKAIGDEESSKERFIDDLLHFSVHGDGDGFGPDLVVLRHLIVQARIVGLHCRHGVQLFMLAQVYGGLLRHHCFLDQPSRLIRINLTAVVGRGDAVVAVFRNEHRVHRRDIVLRLQ